MEAEYWSGEGAAHTMIERPHIACIAQRPAACRIGTRGTMTEKKDIRYCPFCGRTSFELAGEEDDSVYCEHCGVDVKVKELIP